MIPIERWITKLRDILHCKVMSLIFVSIRVGVFLPLNISLINKHLSHFYFLKITIEMKGNKNRMITLMLLIDFSHFK